MDPAAREYLSSHRVARLATVDGEGHPSLVPICFAMDGDAIYSALDEKPKRLAGARLRRVRNILNHPDVALLADDYSEDWMHLSYLLIHGRAELLDPGSAEHEHAVQLLRARYLQYQEMSIEEQPVIRIEPEWFTFWSASGGSS